MIKFVFIVLLLFGFALSVQSQKIYSKWLYGDKGTVNLNTTSIFEITPKGDTSYTVPSDVRFQATVASICDTAGNLLFYTNGISIFGADHKIIQNGDSINFGKYWDTWKIKGYASTQGIQIIPRPNSINEYYLIHQAYEYNDTLNHFYPKYLYYSVIKLDVNKKPYVTLKNKEIFDNFHEIFSLVKHGNGNDYWLFVSEAASNIYQYFKIDSSGIKFDHSQKLEKSLFDPCEDAYGCPSISPNGKYFLRFQHPCDLAIYEIDRWYGKIEKELIISFDTILPFGSGSAFSPDSRKAYVSSRYSIYQIDLDHLPIKLLEVAHMGTYADALPFGIMDLASNGKIYINSIGPFNYMHVIENPDSVGIKCNVKKEGVKLTSNINFTMPRTPNPFLGYLDTTTTIKQVNIIKEIFKAYPNPCSGQITIALNEDIFNNSKFEVELLDYLGRHVSQTKISYNKSITVIDLSPFQNGIYNLLLKEKTRILATQKIVVINN